MTKRWRTVWIVGASSGIGKSLALALAPQCERLVISARSEDKLADISTHAENISFTAFDVTDHAAACVAAKDTGKAGDLDLVVLSSGYWAETEGLDWDIDTFQQSANVNYIGVVNLVDAVKDQMMPHSTGHIAIISSVAGYRGLPNAGSYGPMKAALINFAEAIQPQFAKAGISISLINPGFVKTQLTDKNTFPMPFLMSPEDAAIRIKKGLEKKHFEISFPKRLVWPMKLLRLLPNRLYLWLTSKLI